MEPGEPGAEALIRCSEDYEQASIRVHRNWRTWSEHHASETLAHELLHCHERDLNSLIESLEDVLDESAYKLLKKRYDHERERLIDKLSIILVRHTQGG